mgnify:CR=1 FL=1
MKRVKKPRKSRAKVKFKTKAYVGNPGKKAEMKIDSLKAENEALKKQVDSLKIKLKIK